MAEKRTRQKKEKKPLGWEYEAECHAAGYTAVCGCDEAGRGPLAGPVVAAAVILPDGLVIDGLDDSKKLTEKKREALYDVIIENALAYGIAEASAGEIDEINILTAAMLAMNRAVDKLQIKADFALIDGNTSRGFKIPTRTVVGGDGKSPSIAAASVLAKVTRDRMCLELDRQYPEYGFAGHKGYPTKAHMDAVRKFGPCPEHRKTFLKFLDKPADEDENA
ncbi:MAG: ribonuclease HII [Clostridia bacterium]|nr:ribonuclease HII [Clostridia bacterium]